MAARGAAWPGGLDSEGVFEFLHPRFQILDFSPLLFDEEVFYPAKPDLHLGAPCSHVLRDLFDILFAGRAFEPFVDHLGQLFTGDLCLCHMYSSIVESRMVSSSRPVVTAILFWKA